MRHRMLCLLVAAAFAIACSKEDRPETIAISADQKAPLPAQEINDRIDASLRAKGTFNWSQMSEYELWSATMHGDHVVSIGFGRNPDDFSRDISPDSASIQEKLLSMISNYESRPRRDILISADAYLNTMDVVIEKQETILALKKSHVIRYLEPGNYRFFSVANTVYRPRDLRQSASSATSSGCGYAIMPTSSADFNAIAPSAKAGWNLYQHNIPYAWAYSTGAGITIGIVDTGLSPQQSLLNGNFNNGFSFGRTVHKYGTYVDSAWPWATATDGPNDGCGHGTSMASAATGPRNDHGLPVGVAYNANLIMYRAASNVLLEGYHEQTGVKDAFTALANNAAVKIISMSMGYIFSVGKISDGVKYAYSKGKLIFCAGGTSSEFTSFLGVIFPASMAEAVAVTGVKEAPALQRCDDCHSGSKIEFTVVMQRAGSGNTVPVLSYYDNQSDYVGGSSVATATTAGIAALVWAKHPGWSRDQVLAKMRQSGSCYPNRNPEYGYGNINALSAVQ